MRSGAGNGATAQNVAGLIPAGTEKVVAQENKKQRKTPSKTNAQHYTIKIKVPDTRELLKRVKEAAEETPKQLMKIARASNRNKVNEDGKQSTSKTSVDS